MFQLGELVIYGVHGVCQVREIQERTVDHVLRQYLVLEPVGRGGSQFMVPMHNTAAMGKLSKLLSRQELETLLESSAVRQSNWIQDEGRRKQFYREQSGNANREVLLQTVHTLYTHRKHLRQTGKKFHVCDENFLHDAEKMLSGEISVVLGLDTQAALQYLRDRLQDSE